MFYLLLSHQVCVFLKKKYVHTLYRFEEALFKMQYIQELHWQSVMKDFALQFFLVFVDIHTLGATYAGENTDNANV